MHNQRKGFTLIELSVVLVIIGLIVGGILVGRDLIRGAEERSQIAQIDKLNAAVHTFKLKYGALPGDLPPDDAAQAGFNVGAGCSNTSQAFLRNGNGVIEGWPTPSTLVQGGGESQLFWQDISSPVAGNLIEGQFPSNGGSYASCIGGSEIAMSTTPGTSYIGNYMPAAKIGSGNFVYVYSYQGDNWFGLSAVTSVDNTGTLSSTPNIRVIQAYNIDRKMDDGLPTTGSVQATYINNGDIVLRNANAEVTDSATSCYNTTTNAYSMGTFTNYGQGANCALSFHLQE
jgi:prepilin-type N-terminal cleavage/methylation domain-containing protein